MNSPRRKSIYSCCWIYFKQQKSNRANYISNWLVYSYSNKFDCQASLVVADIWPVDHALGVLLEYDLVLEVLVLWLSNELALGEG